MTQSLNNKVAVITGGTTGIGFATAKRFIDEGARVFLTGTNPERLQQARLELGASATVISSDASKEEDILSLFERVSREAGKIDVLFLNAGIARFAPWLAQSVEEFDKQFAINVRGPWLAIKHGVEHMSKESSILVTTSVANQMGMANASAYSATKAALAQLVRSAASEFSAKGIRINAISPGPIETPIFSKTGIPAEQMQAMTESMSNDILLGRIGKSEEVANLALFLASNESSFVQGQEFVVDGGISL